MEIGRFLGDTSETVMYYSVWDEDNVPGNFNTDETSEVGWYSREDAEKRIQMTTSTIGRKRDLAILKTAYLHHEEYKKLHQI